MNKTISISLNGQLFHVEEDGYRMLEAYLKAVRDHFSSYPDRDEIISDIESRMAEQFGAKTAATNRVVNRADVEEVIKTMGTIDDFKAFEGGNENAGSSHTEQTTKRKLYRDPDDKIIAGVCAGLAAYFGMDPIIPRILFVLTLFAGGTGIIVYIILWLIVPEAETPTQKMAMRGKPLTITELEKKFNETVKRADEQVKKNDYVGRFTEGLTRLVSTLVSVFAKISGLFITVVTAMALFALTFGFVAMLVNVNSPYIDFPLRGIMDQTIFYVLAACAFFAVFVPLQFVLLAGASLLSGKNKFRSGAVAALVAVWFASLLVGGAVGFRYAPEYAEKWHQQEASRVQASKAFTVENFDKLAVSNGFTLMIKQGEAYAVTATGDEEDVNNINIFAEDGTLKAERAPKEKPWRLCLFCPGNREMVINVTMPVLNDLNVSGGSRATLEGFTQDAMTMTIRNGSRIENISTIASVTADVSGGSRLNSSTPAESIDLRVSNASRVEWLANVTTVKAEINGGSRLVLEGNGTTLNANAYNGSTIEAQDFLANDVIVTVSGGSRADVHAKTSLNARATNGSRVEYANTGITPIIEASSGSRVDASDGLMYE